MPKIDRIITKRKNNKFKKSKLSKKEIGIILDENLDDKTILKDASKKRNIATWVSMVFIFIKVCIDILLNGTILYKSNKDILQIIGLLLNSFKCIITISTMIRFIFIKKDSFTLLLLSIIADSFFSLASLLDYLSYLFNAQE